MLRQQSEEIEDASEDHATWFGVDQGDCTRDRANSEYGPLPAVILLTGSTMSVSASTIRRTMSVSASTGSGKTRRDREMAGRGSSIGGEGGDGTEG